MTRRRKNKPKSNTGAQTTRDQVKSTLKKKSSDRMDTDAEDPHDGTRKQEPAWKRYTSYIRHPSWFIDMIFSSMVRIQLFMYQKVAGRLPLFLKEKVENSKQEKSHLTLTVNELNETKKQLSDDNKSLKEKHTELLDTNKALTEKNKEVKSPNKKLSDEVKKLTDVNECRANKSKEQETKIKELEDRNKQQEEKNIELDDNNKALTDDIKELEDSNEDLANKNTELHFKHKELAERNIELNESINELKSKEELQSEQIKSQELQITMRDNDIRNLTDLKDESDKKVVTMSEKIKSLKQKVSMWQDKLTEVERENTELIDRINTLNDEKNVMEAEKHDALRRLSEQVSVKLRDNNPNIVDLSDQCRPTKLAEMFSELYDNEWTNAFSVLEDTFTEEQTIVILLDTVMIAYGFCEERVNEPWQALTDWFLDEKLPGAQQTTKWLKDSRKTNIQKKVPIIEKNFIETILSMCDDENLETLLYDKDIKVYFTKCIELCLLMAATDPPVVLVCPGWKASPCPQKDGTKTSETYIEEMPVAGESEKDSCSQKQPIKLGDNNQYLSGIDEETSADDAGSSGVEESQHETAKTHQNQMTEMIDRNKSDSHYNTEQGKDDSREEHEQQYRRQQQQNGLMHADTEESRQIGEPQLEDQKQYLEEDPEEEDQKDGTSHGITKSIVLEDLSQPEQQYNYQEKEQKQENGDNGIRDECDLTNNQQKEFQKEGSDENVMKDYYERLVDATEKDKMETLQQTGLQESLDDTEAGVSHKEKQEESQMHADTEESRPIGEPEPEDEEQHLEQDPEVKDQNDGTSHAITKSFVLEDLSQQEHQDNYQEKEQEQENNDNGIRDEGYLTNNQQQEFQKEGSDENVMKDYYERLVDATEKDKMETLQQTGLQESLDDTEAGVSHKEKQEESQMHADTKESRPIGEPQPEDEEQHLEQDPEVKDQNDGTSHAITKSVVLEDLSQQEHQDNYQEKEQEQENNDNGIRDEGYLTNIQQQEFQNEGSDENVMNYNYERLVDATEKNKMEALKQTGLQESLGDTEAGVSNKEKQEESQFQDTNLIAGDDSKIIEKQDTYDSQVRQPEEYETLDDIKFDEDGDTKIGAMEGNSDQENTSTLYKTDKYEGTESVPNGTEDPQEGLMYRNEDLFDVTATKEDTDDNIGEDKKVHLHLEKDGNKNITNKNNDIPGDSRTDDQHYNGNTKAATDEMKQATPVMDEKRLLFDKELFKEYTRRGKYLDYIVWPAMCLHKGGPLLHKGVAQGRKGQNLVQNCTGWTWRNLKQ